MRALKDEGEYEAKESKSFSKSESEEGNWLKNATCFWLTCDAVDVSSEDHSGSNRGSDCREAITDQVERAFHFSYLSSHYSSGVLDESFALVLVGKGAGDIESCKQGKNVGLKNLNQEFKESQSDPECKGKWTDELQTDDPFEKVIATQDKNQQKQVPGEHICKKPEGESQGADNEEGRQFQRGEQDIRRFGDPRHKHDVLEVLTDPLLADADVMENEESKDCQYIGETHVGHGRKLQQGNDSKDVIYQDKGEKGKEIGHKTHEFRANVVTGHIIANEAVNTLTGELKLGRHNRGFPRCQQEERGNQKNGEKYQKYWLCGIGIVAKDWREVEVIGAGWNKTTTIGA
jgi:hypothetical protein